MIVCRCRWYTFLHVIYLSIYIYCFAWIVYLCVILRAGVITTYHTFACTMYISSLMLYCTYRAVQGSVWRWYTNCLLSFIISCCVYNFRKEGGIVLYAMSTAYLLHCVTWIHTILQHYSKTTMGGIVNSNVHVLRLIDWLTAWLFDWLTVSGD